MTDRIPILKMTPERFVAVIKRAYELGCNGWMELSEEVAAKLLAECITDLEMVMKSESKPASKCEPVKWTRNHPVPAGTDNDIVAMH